MLEKSEDFSKSKITFFWNTIIFHLFESRRYNSIIPRLPQLLDNALINMLQPLVESTGV